MGKSLRIKQKAAEEERKQERLELTGTTKRPPQKKTTSKIKSMKVEDLQTRDKGKERSRLYTVVIK